MKKLLIYIPTYNRPEALIKQLKNIAQAKTNNFSVLINDNQSELSSSDEKQINDICILNEWVYRKMLLILARMQILLMGI